MNRENIKMSMADLGEKIAVGRSSDIYNYKDGKLIKLFLESFDKNNADIEYQNTVEAFEKGATELQCYGKVDVDGRIGLILDKVEGVPITRKADSNPLFALVSHKYLVAIQKAVNEKTTDVMPNYKRLLLDAMNAPCFDFLDEGERTKAMGYLEGLPDGRQIIHLDIQPENIITNGERSVLIDWFTAAQGVIEADVAMTRYIFLEAELMPGISKAQAFLYTVVKKLIFKNYYRLYKKETGFTDEAVEQWRLASFMRRLYVWDVDSERDALHKKIKECISEL